MTSPRKNIDLLGDNSASSIDDNDALHIYEASKKLEQGTTEEFKINNPSDGDVSSSDSTQAENESTKPSTSKAISSPKLQSPRRTNSPNTLSPRIQSPRRQVKRIRTDSRNQRKDDDTSDEDFRISPKKRKSEDIDGVDVSRADLRIKLFKGDEKDVETPSEREEEISDETDKERKVLGGGTNYKNAIETSNGEEQASTSELPKKEAIFEKVGLIPSKNKADDNALNLIGGTKSEKTVDIKDENILKTDTSDSLQSEEETKDDEFNADNSVSEETFLNEVKEYEHSEVVLECEMKSVVSTKSSSNTDHERMECETDEMEYISENSVCSVVIGSVSKPDTVFGSTEDSNVSIIGQSSIADVNAPIVIQGSIADANVPIVD